MGMYLHMMWAGTHTDIVAMVAIFTQVSLYYLLNRCLMFIGILAHCTWLMCRCVGQGDSGAPGCANLRFSHVHAELQ